MAASLNVVHCSLIESLKIKNFCVSKGIIKSKKTTKNGRIFFKDFIYLFLDRGEGREKEGEKNINVWLPLECPLLGTWPATQTCALDWESNWPPFGLQVCT